jgi:hypothetical protein
MCSAACLLQDGTLVRSYRVYDPNPSEFTGYLEALQMPTGRSLWRRAVPALTTSLAAMAGHPWLIYALTDGRIGVLHTQTGDLLHEQSLRLSDVNTMVLSLVPGCPGHPGCLRDAGGSAAYSSRRGIGILGPAAATLAAPSPTLPPGRYTARYIPVYRRGSPSASPYFPSSSETTHWESFWPLPTADFRRRAADCGIPWRTAAGTPGVGRAV